MTFAIIMSFMNSTACQAPPRNTTLWRRSGNQEHTFSVIANARSAMSEATFGGLQTGSGPVCRQLHELSVNRPRHLK